MGLSDQKNKVLYICLNITVAILTNKSKSISLEKDDRLTYANTIPLDNIDMQIITQLISGSSTKDISHKLHVPLSSVQRKVRRIMNYKIVKTKIEPDFKKMGFKKGLLHIYINNAKLKEMAKRINKMDGVLSTSIHVGNSDLVAEFVYEDSDNLIEIYETIKMMPEVKDVKWSEEVLALDGNGDSIIAAVGKRWNLPKAIK